MEKLKGDKRLKLNILHAYGSSTSKGYRDSIAICDEDGYR